ncbi:MAG: hypothetical protein ACHQHN_19305 [Sphingobacteriales bacterium]
MSIPQKTRKVDMTTVEDCFQLGQFDTLIMYFIYLLRNLLLGTRIILYRFPENGNLVPYKVITNLAEFKLWVEPFLDRM